MIIIALTVVAITAIMLGSYLTLVQYQTASVARSQAWNASVAVSEAGIEEGMSLMNRCYPSPKGDKWIWTAGITSDNWSPWASNITSIHRDIYTNGYGVYSYDVAINITGGNPVITATGFVPFASTPWIFGSNQFVGLSFPLQPFVAAAGLSSGGQSAGKITRVVQVDTKLDIIFTRSLSTSNDITMNGGILVDSYNSTNIAFSSWVTNATWGTNLVYNPNKRSDHGDVATDSSLANAADLGKADIYGTLHTGPGSTNTTASLGNGGAVGSLDYINKGGTGFQSNSWSYDMNVSFPPVPVPTTGSPPTPKTGSYLGTNYTYSLSSADQIYQLNQPLSGTVVVTAPNTILWAKAGISFSGQDGLYIAPGASVQIYVGDNSGSPVPCNLTGQGGMNANGYAVNCQLYGLATCTSISMSGNAAFVGTIYAPYADLTGNGGGKDPNDVMGSIIVKSATFNGHFSFHFDEALATSGPARGWIARNWREINYTGN
ncbi:hypothetical protein Cflav_PD4273 [Pedosphaera parvula Ellin514]|uniref:DUF7305 domain-containing protein n=2 Tax=Pedosphaera TaxID=1032526 RepID=B9XF96_PEDPL|nr:hypothetical protein Cflav_PD4273 [Pedosphaera parvula Ellin514]